MRSTILVTLALAALICSAAADSLTASQVRLLDLMTYFQIARDNCGYIIDVDLLKLTAARERISLELPKEQRALSEGFAKAEQSFSGMRRTVECAYALERFGPNGSDMPGLLKRRPPS